MTVTSPLHPEFQGYYGEEGGGRGEPATRLSEPTDLSRLAGERGRGERRLGAPLVESPRRGVRGDRARPMTVEIRPAQRTEHMWVAPEHPGVGIGAALFEHAVETARQRERRNSGSLQTRTPRVST